MTAGPYQTPGSRLPSVAHNDGSPWWSVSALLVLAAYGFLSLSLISDWPPAWPDESQFAEAARVLSQTGHLQSSLIPGMQEHVYWQPPVYFIFLAAMLRVVEFDLIALRAISIIIGALILILVYATTRRLSTNKGIAVFAMCLLAINPNFVTYIKLVRMDGLSVLLQLTGVLIMLTGRSSQSATRCVASGTLTAAAVLTHPLGIIGGTVCAVHILFSDTLSRAGRVRALGLLLLPFLVAGGAYAWYAARDFPQWREQMLMQFQRKTRSPCESLYNMIIRYRTLPLFALLAAWSIAAWVKSRLWRRSARHRTLGLAAGVALLAVSFTFELSYHVHLLPWLSIAMALAILEWLPRWNPVQRGAVFVMLALVGINLCSYSLYFIHWFHWGDSPPPSYETFYADVAEHIPRGAQTLLYGYPDGYWALLALRPDLQLREAVVFNEHQRHLLANSVTSAVIARAFDPVEDSLSLFSDVRRILGSPLQGEGVTVNSVGSMVRYHPSAWVITWEAPGKKK
jgi:hypothetical protein